MNNQELTQAVRSFFEDYLDLREESESGRLFYPVQVSSCRAAQIQPLNALLERMRVLSGAKSIFTGKLNEQKT